MTTMFVRHIVANYETWRKHYDEFVNTQKALGVTGEAVYQSADNPNEVTVTHEFPSIERARAFVESQELRNKMREAGVVGEPTIWFTNKT